MYYPGVRWGCSVVVMKVLLCKGPLVAKEGTGLRTEDELNPTRGRQTDRQTDKDRDKRKRMEEKKERSGFQSRRCRD